ncbi:hypothetical protein PJI17_31475, partial [Mycobacterium kansasii]
GIQVPIAVNQKKWKKSRGLGAESSVNMMTVSQEEKIGLNIIDKPEAALKQMEDGGQPTIDSLKEINLGTEEEPRNTFISTNLPQEEADLYISLLKENRDVFAWTYAEM